MKRWIDKNPTGATHLPSPEGALEDAFDMTRRMRETRAIKAKAAEIGAKAEAGTVEAGTTENNTEKRPQKHIKGQ